MIALLALVGCAEKDGDETGSGGGDSAGDDSGGGGDTAASGEGTLAVSFSMDDDLVASMPDGEEPVGTFWGEIYPGDAVDSGYPTGAPIASLTVEEVDLRPDGGPSAVLATTDLLPAGVVAILGGIDTDGSGEIDEGDPVTFPSQNKFLVVGGAESPAEVVFGLLNPM